MTNLSHVRYEIAYGLLKPKEFVSIYRLMIEILPANLQKNASRPMNKEELEMARGQYLREHLPDLAG